MSWNSWNIARIFRSWAIQAEWPAAPADTDPVAALAAAWPQNGE
ncbi:hypothetical protein AB0D04_17995 [Streptomyces sp. NPDC048483]